MPMTMPMAMPITHPVKTNVKRSYVAKMLRKYEHLTNKRIRDKQLLLDRHLKDLWTLEL